MVEMELSVSDAEKPMRTAQYMGRYYQELQEEGLTSDQAFELVKDAAHQLMADDMRLLVKAAA